MVKVTEKESYLVKPSKETPKVCLWMSNIDQTYGDALFMYFYRRPALTDATNSSSCSHDFFNTTVLEDSLSKALVTYYPIAGRIKRDESDKGRAEIDCTGEGVRFIKAETDSLIEGLGDFSPTEQLRPLLPNHFNKDDIDSCPILSVQVTHFKCGGVCLSITISHKVVDGVSVFNFINTCSDLCQRYKLPYINTSSTSSLSNPKVATANLNISTMQVDQLKSQRKKDGSQFTTYEVIAGHLWRCQCKARELAENQETVISFSADSRSYLSPPLPDVLFGNSCFSLTPAGISGDIVSKPLSYVVGTVHETISSSRKDEYFSILGQPLIELHPNISTLTKFPETFKGCNIRNSSWVWLPIYEADFGWGRPVYVGPGFIGFPSRTFLAPKPPGEGTDGGFSLIISLESDYHMKLFKEYFYNI
ncbi:hypothetical protein MKW94_005154 [Papaver nudicaule]|uniref:Uncharacterized protein n=1 Tax=Papaver nudicaule TaxID=74823 RepID=A0AA42B4K0_PAPNU|nr:hypothetical protein [Papaver nudicaule]